MGRRWAAASPTPPEPEQCKLPTDRKFSSNLAQAGQAMFAGGLMGAEKEQKKTKDNNASITEESRFQTHERSTCAHTHSLHWVCQQQTSLVMFKLPKIQRYNQHGASQKIVANTTSPEQEHNMKYMLSKTTKKEASHNFH